MGINQEHQAEYLEIQLADFASHIWRLQKVEKVLQKIRSLTFSVKNDPKGTYNLKIAEKY